MPDDQARARAVYDYADEEPRPNGRRRRQVADWGVGEELFDRLPGPRFERQRPAHAIPRGGAADGRRTVVIVGDDPAPPAAEEPVEEFASREEALRAHAQHEAVWAGDEPFGEADRRAEAELPAADLAPSPPPPEIERSRAAHDDRRTVKITGRPAEFAVPRRRPRRAVADRLGGRPDRIAAWAVALGLLLILVAILTAM